VKRTGATPISISATAILLFVAVSQAAHSQATRSWVSVNGNDGNDCSRATPCRTLSGALAKTSTGGEIDVLDSGDFGSVTLNKSISVVTPGVLGGIQVGTGTAITINAGANDKIVLRGLSIDGLGTGDKGVLFTAGGSLYIENCTINNFLYGVYFVPTNGSGKLFIMDTVVRNNSTAGVWLIATTGPGFVATIDGLRSENNGVGLRADSLGVVTVRNSVSAGNGWAGFTAYTPPGFSGAVRMFIENSVSTHNGTIGVQSNGSGATVTISNVVVTDNQTGLGALNSGSIVSFGNNKIQNNTTDGAPTQTILQQ
jgi:hypothetical protein